MKPMNRHLHRWIANVANGDINTMGVNDANGTNELPFVVVPMDRQSFRWPMMSLMPLMPSAFIGNYGRQIAMKWRRWSHLNFTIALVANGYRHRHQWRWDAPLGPSPLAPMHHFCRHLPLREWCQWRKFQIVMTLLPKLDHSLCQQTSLHWV